jgi:hypothetical protein
VDGYDGTIYSTNAGIPNEEGFATPSVGDFWHQEIFDLNAYVGHNVRIRLHFGSDGSVTYPGWYIDDLMVTAPAAIPDPVVDLQTHLMEESICLTWSPPSKVADVDHYVVYRSESHDFLPSPADSIGSTGDTVFVDTNSGAGSPGTNHYYVVEAVSSSGYHSEKSNTVGEFDKLLQVAP